MPNLNSKRRPWQKKREPFEGAKRSRNLKFYNSKVWRTNGRLYREHNPICEVCERKGLIEVATQVDHIKPIEDGGAKLDWSNMQSICTSCHAKKTARECRTKK